MRLPIKPTLFFIAFSLCASTLLGQGFFSAKSVSVSASENAALIEQSQLNSPVVNDANAFVDQPIITTSDITETVVYTPPSLERIPSKNELIFSLDVVKEAIMTDKYAIALSSVNDLLSKLKERRQIMVGGFFPSTFDTFQSSTIEQTPGYFSNVEDDYGVIFSRQYTDGDVKKVDINLVYADPSIQEYITTIANPKLVKKLSNSNIILVNGAYKGLQKFSEDDLYCEMNILVDDTILINIIAIGVHSPSDLTPLLDTIKFNDIKLFLE